MDTRTAQALGALNRRFYARHAASFSHRRERPWPGWRRVLAACDPRPGDPLAVLDAGCGNGRFAEFLLAERPGALDYLGCDSSPELLAEARARLAGRLEPERFRELDVLHEDLGSALGGRRFDLVALFGVLHHVPGFERRRALLERLGERLAPGGTLAVTIWRFADAARLARKLVTWERAPPGVEPAQLEPGDLLLDWEGDASCPRYCHLASEEEIAALLAAVPLRCTARFASDGERTGVYNDYLLLAAGG